MMSGDISTLFYRRPSWIDVRDLYPGPDPLWLREIHVPFHFEHAGNVLYVQINTVADAKDETLAHFAQRVHDEIVATKPDKVAIDLRQDRGGNNTFNLRASRN
jgi:C-terminal processing protease CtpA/Prc